MVNFTFLSAKMLGGWVGPLGIWDFPPNLASLQASWLDKSVRRSGNIFEPVWSCFLDGRLSLPFPRPFRLAGWGITVLLFYYYGRNSTSVGCRLEDYKNAIIIIYVVFYEKGWKGWARAQGPAKYTPWYPRIQTLAVLNQLFRLCYETSSRAAKLRQFETISHLINPKLTPKGKV